MYIKFNKKKILIFFIFFLICIILILLANRYLIEHVELDNISTDDNVNIYEDNSSDTDSVYTDDTSYISSTKKITISKVSTSLSDSKVVYYIADILLTNPTDLKSAFAKDKYGTNIIEYTSTIAKNNNAIFAVNGDYYGFRTTGIVIRNGVIYRNSPARDGLAIYKDGSMKVYDETKTSAEDLINDGVYNTYSFGPVLVENGNVVSGIDTIEIDTNFGNHSIQGKEPRTGIGFIDNNHYVVIVVDGRSSSYSSGVTMIDFANIFKNLGCSIAYNLDGGGSSTMYFMGNVVNNPLGKNKERGTSDILYIS